MKRKAVSRVAPGPSGTLPSRASRRARWPWVTGPSARTPTLATSPSSRALVAWVVEWAMSTTSSGAMPVSSRSRCIDWTTPAATPSSWSCVVGTTALPTSSVRATSTATAWVKVPPTSMPIFSSAVRVAHEQERRSAEVEDDRAPDEGQGPEEDRVDVHALVAGDPDVGVGRVTDLLHLADAEEQAMIAAPGRLPLEMRIVATPKPRPR